MAQEGVDFIVVGGGSAGCVLASRLSESGRDRVLLLEAGGRDDRWEIQIPAVWTLLFKSDCDWDYATAPEPQLHGRSVYWPRGKVLGGSSSINAQIYLRGHRLDFDAWGALGNPGWSYAEVLPYFKRAERHADGESELHGADGPLCVSHARFRSPLTCAFVDAGVQSGLARKADLNDGELEGIGYLQFSHRRGARHSTAAAYLRPALQRSNLSVVCGAEVTRVLVEQGVAVGVEYVHGGERRTVRAAREVVLSAGAVGSPKLLLLSGIGPAEPLREWGIPVAHALPGVGRNLQDHLMCGVAYTCSKPWSLYGADSWRNVLRYALLRRGPLACNAADAAAFVRTRPELPWPDLGLVFTPALVTGENLSAPKQHGFAIAPSLLRPRSVGEIRLRGPDPHQHPVIAAGYLSDPGGEDLRVLIEGMRLARRIGDAPALAQIRGPEQFPGPQVKTDEELAEVIRARSLTYYHPVGTCKMGRDPLAVVDARLRVHGVAQLRVVDASVMPSLISANTNAATIMIAERAAEWIRG